MESVPPTDAFPEPPTQAPPASSTMTAAPPIPRAGRSPRLLDLRPKTLLARARFEPRHAFVSWFEETPLVLVQLDPYGLIAAALSETASTEGKKAPPSPDALSFSTTTTVVRPSEDAARLPLQASILHAPHFAVMLRKRTRGNKPFAHRISVGRARNNDVVLRDSTISKFHAWFERDEEGVFFLFDAGSKNETRLNGTKLAPKQPMRLESEDKILFGGLPAIFCSPEALWDAIAAIPEGAGRDPT